MKNKLTMDDINASMQRIEYIRYRDTTLTVCYITLNNGTVVLGQSACIDPAGFDARTGEEIALKDAVSKVWSLEGYALMQKRYEVAIPSPAQGPATMPAFADANPPSKSALGKAEQSFMDSHAINRIPEGLFPPGPVPVEAPKLTVPTVGRIVYYYPRRNELGMFDMAEIGEPLPAIICYVHDEHSLNLVVFGAVGTPISMRNINLIHPEDEDPDYGDYNEQDDVGGYAKWMPYQIKAAKKYPVDK